MKNIINLILRLFAIFTINLLVVFLASYSFNLLPEKYCVIPLNIPIWIKACDLFNNLIPYAIIISLIAFPFIFYFTKNESLNERLKNSYPLWILIFMSLFLYSLYIISSEFVVPKLYLNQYYKHTEQIKSQESINEDSSNNTQKTIQLKKKEIVIIKNIVNHVLRKNIKNAYYELSKIDPEKTQLIVLKTLNKYLHYYIYANFDSIKKGIQNSKIKSAYKQFYKGKIDNVIDSLFDIKEDDKIANYLYEKSLDRMINKNKQIDNYKIIAFLKHLSNFIFDMKLKKQYYSELKQIYSDYKLYFDLKVNNTVNATTIKFNAFDSDNKKTDYSYIWQDSIDVSYIKTDKNKSQSKIESTTVFFEKIVYNDEYKAMLKNVYILFNNKNVKFIYIPYAVFNDNSIIFDIAYHIDMFTSVSIINNNRLNLCKTSDDIIHFNIAQRMYNYIGYTFLDRISKIKGDDIIINPDIYQNKDEILLNYITYFILIFISLVIGYFTRLKEIVFISKIKIFIVYISVMIFTSILIYSLSNFANLSMFVFS